MDIVAFVNKHPKVGETIFGNDVQYFPGGKGANQAVACRRLGCETSLIGRLGDDPFGERLLAFHKQEGINTSGVSKIADSATGIALITVSENSDNSIVVISGANSQWDDWFSDDVAINPGDWVLAQFEIPDPVIHKAFAKAKACGAMTLLNPSPVRAIPEPIQNLTDLVVVNEHELAGLSGCGVDTNNEQSVFNAMARLEQAGYASMVVTLGERGVRLRNAGQTHVIPARPVIAVDTTGAGDAFIGGLVAGLLSDMVLKHAAEFANVAASISVTRQGAAVSIPTINEVTAIMDRVL